MRARVKASLADFRPIRTSDDERHRSAALVASLRGLWDASSRAALEDFDIDKMS